ncbi:MAG: hypothetical protein COA44_05165 [Arcobacter sp.]|nr:MAG: hypothetical protein COA44_05165 [Arcobacter sp.]
MKTKLLLVLTFIVFTACSESPVETKTSTTIIDTKIDSIQAAKKIVEVVNAKIHKEESIAIEVSAPSGANLYTQKCASCHGKDGKKSALNASEVIAGWESSKTQGILKGYQDGTYGKKMKNIMQGQTKPLSKTDIKLISDYISIL